MYERAKVRYIGDEYPVSLRKGKIYEAIIGQLGFICLVDETGEEYGFPPYLFEILERLGPFDPGTAEQSKR